MENYVPDVKRIYYRFRESEVLFLRTMNVSQLVKHQNWRTLEINLFLLVLIPIAVSFYTVLQIAGRSGFNVHPDEYAHMDAICYFENHWWPPDLNSSGIAYSDYGWSRLYDGELVYLIFGKLIRLSERVTSLLYFDNENNPVLTNNGEINLDTPSVQGMADCGKLIRVFRNYRMLNVLLYLVTLLFLTGFGRTHRWLFLITLVLLCLPQVNYLYSYVNSDAWGLTMSLFLFAYVVIRQKRILNSWTDLLVLAILTGLVILSKKTFWLSIPYAYLLIGLELLGDFKVSKSPFTKRHLVRIGTLITLTLLFIAPLKVLYPLSQGNFEEQALEMREERATPGFKPSQPTREGFHLGERGYSFRSVSNPRWVLLSAASFYALFGYMTERLPQWLYFFAYVLIFLLSAITYLVLVFRWKEIPFSTRFMILLAPLSILSVVLASMYNSWTFDYQPQGRYLFAGLIPLALILGGLFQYESRSVKIFRLVSWLVLYIVCLGILWIFVLGNPVLIPQ